MRPPTPRSSTPGHSPASLGRCLHVLHVVDTASFNIVVADAYAGVTPDLLEQAEEAARIRLDERAIDSDGSDPPTRKALSHAASSGARDHQYATDECIDLIVMGTHGRRGVAHLLIGSVAERVVRTASCPVLTVHHPEHEFVIPDIGGPSRTCKGATTCLTHDAHVAHDLA